MVLISISHIYPLEVRNKTGLTSEMLYGTVFQETVVRKIPLWGSDTREFPGFEKVTTF